MKFVPNILSTLRLFLAFIFPFTPEWMWIWLIVGSGCSDFLDGWIARKWQVQSWQGGLLDAVADKSFVFIVLITLAGANKFSPWWIPALISRDLTVGFAALYASFCRLWESFRKMDARWSGKLATGGQFFFLIVIVLFPELPRAALYITVFLSFVASCDYGILFFKALRKRAEARRHTTR